MGLFDFLFKKDLGLIDLAEYEDDLWRQKGMGIPLMPVPMTSPMHVTFTKGEEWERDENRRQAQAIYDRVKNHRR